jgi:hypothetical protein
MKAARAIACGEQEMIEWCGRLYGKDLKTMTLEEMQDFLAVLKDEFETGVKK